MVIRIRISAGGPTLDGVVSVAPVQGMVRSKRFQSRSLQASLLRALVGVVSILLLLASADRAVAATFQGLGDLAGATFESAGGAVSADGTVVVGNGKSATLGTEPFRWTSGGGMVGLGSLGGGTAGAGATGVSPDGSVVVGGAASGGSVLEAFRWTSGGGIVGLGYLGGGGSFRGANGISADETIVVGFSDSTTGFEPFRWTSGGGGTMVSLGILPGGFSGGNAIDISADGTVIVGFSANAFFDNEAFQWTSGGGMVSLGILPGGFSSHAHGISADGTIIVGYSTSGSGQEAFRWTSGGGMVGLGDLTGGAFGSQAYAVSADGTVVVGEGTSASGVEAFIWDATNGMQELDQVLTGLGVDLTGWTLIAASSIADDNLTITGYGTNPSGDTEAWLADLGTATPPSVPLLGVTGRIGLVAILLLAQLTRRRRG